MGANGPVEPSAEMRQFAAVMFQMYSALTQEGFERLDALAIIGKVIAANINGSQPPE